MAVVDPYPGIPVDGGPGDAVPILGKFNALFQGVQNFDGSQINAGSVQSAALANNINPQVRGSETLSNFVYSGCIWSAVSGFSGTMTGGTIYVNGYRTIVSGVGANTFAASSDTYVDIDYLGNVYYLAVANNASSPSLTANALRVAKIITNASAITSVVQSGYDSNFVPIYAQSSLAGINPVKLTIGNTVQSFANSGTAGGTVYYINIGGIKLCWGITGSLSVTGTGDQSSAYGINFPNGFFNTIQSAIATASGGATNSQYLYVGPNTAPTTSGWAFYLIQTSGTNGVVSGVSWFVIGS